MTKKITKCCICHGPLDIKRDKDGVVFWDQGENAQPVHEGRCCVACNNAVVIPARLGRMGLNPNLMSHLGKIEDIDPDTLAD